MRIETLKKAFDRVKDDVVVYCDDSTPRMLHFKVKQQSNDNWADVWYSMNKYGFFEWSCNAISTNKRGRTWSCAMTVNKDMTKPQCSHTALAAIKLEQLKQKGGKDDNNRQDKASDQG